MHFIFLINAYTIFNINKMINNDTTKIYLDWSATITIAEIDG